MLKEDLTELLRDCYGQVSPRVAAKLVITVIADDIERTTPNRHKMLSSDYGHGVIDEHAYIVEYLRGLLKEE